MGRPRAVHRLRGKQKAALPYRFAGCQQPRRSHRDGPVLAITANVRRIYPFDVYLEDVLDQPSKVQGNQIRTISKERLLGPAIAHLPGALMLEVDAALSLHLAL